MNLVDLTIAEARAAIAAGRLSCSELAEATLDRIDRLDARFRAFITVRSREAVMRDAQELDGRRSEGIPLLGIPVALKDNFATRGIRTTAGSAVLAHWVPSDDAHVVTRLRAAGALLVGKLNMHEFADGPTNDNPHWGRPTNPWDPTRTCGGSSGGSAVALAAGMCLGATGTDTGGSIRTPAAFCGVVGLKPTFGLVGRSGIVPFSESLDHAGPMARTVADVAALLSSMAGLDPRDRGSVDVGDNRYERALTGEVAGLRIGVERAYFTAVMSSGVRSAFETALHDLAQLGVQIRDVSIPALRGSLAAQTTVMFSEAVTFHGETLRRRYRDYGRDVRVSLLSGRLYTAVDYVRAQAVRSLLRGQIDRVLRDVDLLVMPTVVMEPPAWGADTFLVDGIEYDTLNAFIRCTSPFNLTGHPALSVPCGFGERGLPIGLQFAARHFQEATLLRVGHAYERTQPRVRPPALVESGAD